MAVAGAVLLGNNLEVAIGAGSTGTLSSYSTRSQGFLSKLKVTAERILGARIQTSRMHSVGKKWGTKMGAETSRVTEIVETGGIIAHAIFEAGNEIVAGDVTMMALMERSVGSEEVLAVAAWWWR
jgi:hypothetical protein